MLDGDIPSIRRAAEARATVRRFNRKGIIMEHQLMEWGPAHLREEAPRLEIELAERPDDN